MSDLHRLRPVRDGKRTGEGNEGGNVFRKKTREEDETGSRRKFREEEEAGPRRKFREEEEAAGPGQSRVPESVMPRKKELAAADLGTTTIAMEWYDSQGQKRGEYVCVNPQRIFGTDVISRIQAAVFST